MSWDDVVEAVRRGPRPAILESSHTDARMGRFSYASRDPFLTIRAWGRAVTLATPTQTLRVDADPFRLVQAVLSLFRAVQPAADLPPFMGGAMGVFGYDLGRVLEHLPALAPDDGLLPDLDVGLYDRVVATDHQRARTWVLSTVPSVGDSRAEWRDPEAIVQPHRAAERGAAASPSRRPCFRTETSRRTYLAAIAAAQEAIAAGEIYQVNLSQRLVADWGQPVWPLYAALRRQTPVPYGAYLDLGDRQVLSASPERFVRLDGRQVQTRPIKGTRPRLGDPAADRAAGAALCASAKDRAENLMIVDLLRNDLGKVCRVGSIRVPDLFRLEAHPGVWHLVSTIEGELEDGLDALDLLRAVFPGGSVTGCPKLRAMEIIERLEPRRRGVYCGAIGYISFTGAMDASIAIRTLVHAGGSLALRVGGAITADSVPEDEYDETLAKARAALDALDADLQVVP